MESQSLNPEESKEAFLQAKTLPEFLQLWASFYDNKIYIPTYMAPFVNTEGDNPQANQELADKFKILTAHGLICINSQVMIPFEQKAYLSIICPRSVVSSYCTELNRYEDIIAFSYPNSTSDVWDLCVTYDTDGRSSNNVNNKLNPNWIRKTKGSSFSTTANSTDDIESIQEWLSDDLREILNTDNYVAMEIMSPSFKIAPFYIFDIAIRAAVSVQLFIEFADMLTNKSSTSVAEISNFLDEHADDLALDESFKGVNLGILAFKSDRPTADKESIILLLLNKGMMALDIYRTVLLARDLELAEKIKPYAPAWFLKANP